MVAKLTSLEQPAPRVVVFPAPWHAYRNCGFHVKLSAVAGSFTVGFGATCAGGGEAPEVDAVTMINYAILPCTGTGFHVERRCYERAGAGNLRRAHGTRKVWVVGFGVLRGMSRQPVRHNEWALACELVRTRASEAAPHPPPTPRRPRAGESRRFVVHDTFQANFILAGASMVAQLGERAQVALLVGRRSMARGLRDHTCASMGEVEGSENSGVSRETGTGPCRWTIADISLFGAPAMRNVGLVAFAAPP